MTQTYAENIEAEEAELDSGEIITFYSYKGGTGRTMALVNTAVLLGERCKPDFPVLAIDWDLEAPGLHRYFANRIERFKAASGGPKGDVEALPGLIDLWYRLIELTESSSFGTEEPGESGLIELERALNLSQYIIPTDIPNVSYMKAGCSLERGYGSRVSDFPWKKLFFERPWLSNFLGRLFASHFRYTLVDSRTGITDSAGICTTLLPDKLVLVFTPNAQSLLGVIEVGRRVLEYRTNSKDDPRPISIFPLPSRIDKSEGEEFTTWRKGPEGYQKKFEQLFQKAYRLDSCNLDPYFDEAQVPHSSWYAYGERIAVLEDSTNNRLSLKRSFVTFENILRTSLTPWKDDEGPFIEPATNSQAHLTYANLVSEKQMAAKKLLLRMILVGPNGEFAARRVLAEKLVEPIVAELILGGIIREHVVVGDVLKTRAFQIDSTFLNSSLVQSWIAQDLSFLRWRQSLADALEAWKNGLNKPGYLLRGAALKEAKHWRETRRNDLTPGEIQFIAVSANRLRQIYRKVGVAAAISIAAFSSLAIVGCTDFGRYQMLVRNLPSAEPLSLMKKSTEKSALILALGQELPTPEDTLRQWFKALRRLGKLQFGTTQIEHLPKPLKFIALAALEHGDTLENSPAWLLAVKGVTLNQNLPSTQKDIQFKTDGDAEVAVDLNFEREHLDDSVAAAAAIKGEPQRALAFSRIIAALVANHHDVEAGRVARIFDMRASSPSPLMADQAGVVLDPLVELYRQIYLVDGALPPDESFAGEHPDTWGLEKEIRYRASSGDVQERALLEIRMAQLRHVLYSNDKSVRDKPTSANPNFRASLDLEAIRVWGYGNVDGHAAGRSAAEEVYRELLAAPEMASLKISDVPYMGGFAAFDPGLRASDVATAIFLGTCRLWRSDKDCQKVTLDAGRTVAAPAIDSIARVELALGEMYRSIKSPEHLEKAIQYADQIDQPDVRSFVLADISIRASEMHRFAQAKTLADKCQTDDKMRALAALITDYNS